MARVVHSLFDLRIGRVRRAQHAVLSVQDSPPKLMVKCAVFETLDINHEEESRAQIFLAC
jgi:hypothetical protein